MYKIKFLDYLNIKILYDIFHFDKNDRWFIRWEIVIGGYTFNCFLKTIKRIFVGEKIIGHLRSRSTWDRG